ncbi:beclin-1-like protein isoform X2 [Homarus americanus]|uniref:beclin-1-like protein isoform X2 n=2 Tax=Homarus americanus TaxID=6706 RepID=UPI001C45D83A|nr:beclin-1-like protein isoform X2 [Homarus americanus]
MLYQSCLNKHDNTMDPRVTVNFVCQRCLHPIQLDPGFSHLNEHTLAELALPIYPGEEVEFDPSVVDKLVPPLQLTDSGHHPHGFTLVGESGDTEKTQPLKVATGLYDLVSSNSDIDHPLCEECTDALLDLMDTTLSRTQRQAHMSQQLLASLTDMPDTDVTALENELANLQLEEERLIKELAEVESEQDAAQCVLEKHEEEKARLEDEEERYWREYCTHKSQLTAMEDENRSLKSQLSYTQNQLERLKKTNVFNTTFHIWHSGHFGTINNLRLGRLPTAPVAWQEINAAWGQTVLLLASLARKIGLKFSKYRLVPYGNHSYIEVIGENRELPLYGSGGFRFLWDTKFDAGMTAFLECVAEFQQHVEAQGGQAARFCLPYRINKHCIEDPNSCNSMSIKIQFNTSEQWTKALKFLLTNLKWGLTWASSALFSSTQGET